MSGIIARDSRSCNAGGGRTALAAQCDSIQVNQSCPTYGADGEPASAPVAGDSWPVSPGLAPSAELAWAFSRFSCSSQAWVRPISPNSSVSDMTAAMPTPSRIGQWDWPRSHLAPKNPATAAPHSGRRGMSQE